MSQYAIYLTSEAIEENVCNYAPVYQPEPDNVLGVYGVLSTMPDTPVHVTSSVEDVTHSELRKNVNDRRSRAEGILEQHYHRYRLSKGKCRLKRDIVISILDGDTGVQQLLGRYSTLVAAGILRCKRCHDIGHVCEQCEEREGAGHTCRLCQLETEVESGSE